MSDRKRIGRQHIGVELVDGTTFEVWTRPIDDDLRAITAQKHGWPTPTDNPVGYLMFLAWVAGRRDGHIDKDVKYEAFAAQVLELEVLEREPIDPTQPGPGPG